MMQSAKAQYSEEKKAYDIRNQAESEVASVAQVVRSGSGRLIRVNLIKGSSVPIA
jgi:hypothetical protein